MITLGVSDLRRAVTFYEDVVGWKAAPGPEGIAFFDLNGLVFSLYPDSDLAKDMDESATGRGYEGYALAHNVRSAVEVDAVFERLKSRGATVVKEPQKTEWGGYSGYFCDPDGHKWEVAHNPYWTIRSDGSIWMKADGTGG
ncbi:MAG: VOC family protein [Actinomycetota bacterium]